MGEKVGDEEEEGNGPVVVFGPGPGTSVTDLRIEATISLVLIPSSSGAVMVDLRTDTIVLVVIPSLIGLNAGFGSGFGFVPVSPDCVRAHSQRTRQMGPLPTLIGWSVGKACMGW